MNIRFLLRFISLAIVASFSAVGFAQSAQSFGLDARPVAISAKPKIAILLPEKGSLYDAVNVPIVSGIKAENRQNGSPYEIIEMPRKWGQSALSHLQDAALIGAVAAIGPINRDAVDEITKLEFLPLPTVALNTSSEGIVAPELIMNFSLNQVEEARQIARIAIAALPKQTSKGEMPKVMIFEANSSLDQRIAAAYEEEMQKAMIPYERVALTKELMAKSHFYELEDNDEDMPKLEPLPDPVEDPYGYQRVRLQNKRIMAQYRSKAAYQEPPYFAALLAMDARSAAMVKPRLPRLTRVWGTSLINPGDPHNRTIASMTYDLQNVGFVDSPLALMNNAMDFKASFGVPMPARVLDVRLFAMGVDAYRLAHRWSKWQTDIQINATTGQLSFKQSESASVQRVAQPAMIESNFIGAKTEEQLMRNITRPE